MAGSLSAQVINVQNNQPIEGAAVELGGPQTQQTRTESDGKFKFENLSPANNYTMQVSADGFRTEHYEDIVVIDDNDTNLGMLALWPENT